MSGISALERLMFTVGLHDMVSDPLNNINRTLTGVRRNATSGFDAIRGGAVGLGASFLSIKTLMEPVYEMDNALGEVRSLGVIEQELDTLKTSALNFSVAYGESAADFVKSSYDIQSAIGGLTNGELASFTEASNILAKGTKADAATITGYMGTMYGIFGQQAAQMGKAEWVQQLTGQTAAAVQMFKTTGQEMSGAFSALGASAQSAGISMSEQMAILGTLQASMSGSEAATKYRAFLTGVGKAQEKLGLQFTDSNGRLLPMVEILDRINSKYSDLTIDAQKTALKDAFGSDEALALITGLIGKTDGLNDSLTKLGRITGMKNAEDMAKAMVDPWEQFEAATIGVRIAFGSALLPTINDVLAKLTDGLTVVMGWTREFPHLTKWIAMTVMSVLLLTGAVGLMSIVVGMSRVAWSGLLSVWLLTKTAMIGVIWLAGLMRTGLIALRAIMLSVAIYAAVMTSPFWATVIVIGVIIAAIAAGIYYLGDWLGWWEKIGDWFSNTEWGAGIMKWFADVGKLIDELVGKFTKLINFDLSWSDLNPFSNTEWGAGIMKWFADVGKLIDELVGKFTKLINFDLSWSDLNPFSDTPKIEPLNSNRPNTGAGREHITDLMKGGGGTNWGGVTIHTNGGMTPAQLEQWAALNGG